MEEECDRVDLQVKGLSLIDFSSENDALVINSSPSPLTSDTSCGLHNHQSSEKQKELHSFGVLVSLGAGNEAGMTPSTDLDDQLPNLNESSEPNRARGKGKCNLRKSLAWDSAFFTSAGVLDPEELSCLTKGAEKSEKQKLPGIQEDIQRSTDSISTTESDNLTLEDLEVELFEDIRASIQKSSKAFNTTNANCKMTSGESQAITSMKKMDLASNQKPALKKPVGTSKSQPKQTLGMQVAVKAVKRDSICSQMAQSAVRPGNSNRTLPKPTPVINKGKSISTTTEKRASLVVSQANKLGNDKTTIGIVAGKGAQALKAPVISGARRVLPKSSSCSSSASVGSLNSTKTKSATSSLADSSGNVSSDKVGKSHLVAVRRKTGERSANPRPPGSTLKTPSKSAARNKMTSGNSAVSAYLMSSKISSSISPASSVSEWSSASSSCSCTINQMSDKSRTSLESNSCRSLDNDTIPSSNNHSNNQTIEEHGNEGIAIQNGSTRKSSLQAGTLSHSTSVRPSGLRMPSPKIGFFDGAKSVRTPNGTMQSHVSLGVLPKVGAAIPSPMKPKIGKFSHARTVLKKNPQESTYPMSTGEKSLASLNFSRAESDMEGCPISSHEVIDELSRESCLKFEEVGGEGLQQTNHVVGDTFGALINQNRGVPFLQETGTGLEMDGIAHSKANKILAGKDARDNEDELASVLPTLLRTDEKENVVFAEHL